MTVTNTKSYNEYVSTGVETSWAFTFDVQEVGQIVVLEIDENNIETDVTASATIDLGSRTVTYGPIAAGRKLRIERRTIATQNVDLENQGPILPQVLESALDKLTYIAQETANAVSDMRSAVSRDIKYAGDWKTGTLYKENQAVTAHGNLYIAKISHLSDTSNAPIDLSSNDTWALAAERGHTPVWRGTWSPGTSYNKLDMYEHNGASYICKQDHVSSSLTEPGIGADWGTYQDRLVVSTPSDGSITTAKLANGSVTPVKIDSTQDFTFGITYANAFVSDKNANDANEGGRIAFEPPTNAVNIDTTSKWNSMIGIYTDGIEDFFKFAWKDSGGIWRSYRIPIDAGGYIWTDGNFAARIAALTANTAPTGTESVACDNGRKVTLQAIADLNPGPAKWTSGALVVPRAGASVSVPHTLPTATKARAYVKCVVATGGYSVGDIVELTTDATYYQKTLWFNSTTVGYSSYFSDVVITTKDGKARVTLSGSANWELYLEVSE